jgi:hypothetical protein
MVYDVIVVLAHVLCTMMLKNESTLVPVAVNTPLILKGCIPTEVGSV